MAIYHQTINIIDRKSGRSAVAAAAYRAGEKIDDERTGEIHDYSRKRGIVHSELTLPGGGTEDRATYWNRVEKHHKRGDAILSREVEIAIPAELNEKERQQLASRFSRELADKYGVAADLNIHKPHRAKADNRNHHGHIMLSACYTAADGTLGKKAVELDPIHCQRNKLENMADWTRSRWAELANDALQKAGHREQIDHRSLEAQKVERLAEAQELEDMKLEPEIVAMLRREAAELDRPATIHLGPSATALERRGIRTDRGDYNRDVIDLVMTKADRQGLEDHLGEVIQEIGFVTKEIEIEDAKAELERERAAAAAKKKVQTLDVVATIKVPKVEPVPAHEIKIEKKQEVESFPERARSKDLPPSLGNVPTPISSEPVSTPKPFVPEAQSEALPPIKKNTPTPQQPAFEPVPAPPALTIEQIETKIREREALFHPTASQIEEDTKWRFPQLQAAKDRLKAVIEAIKAFNRKVEAWRRRGEENGWEREKTYIRPAPREWQQEARELDKQQKELSDEKRQATYNLEQMESHVRFHGGSALKAEAHQQMKTDPILQQLEAERRRLLLEKRRAEPQQTKTH